MTLMKSLDLKVEFLYICVGGEKMAGEEGGIRSSGSFNQKPKTREWGVWRPCQSAEQGKN